MCTKICLESLKERWEDNIKMDSMEMDVNSWTRLLCFITENGRWLL
jgi:hypothetical protein